MDNEKNKNPNNSAAKNRRFDLLPASTVLKVMSCKVNIEARVSDTQAIINNALNNALTALMQYLDGNFDKDWLTEAAKNLIIAVGVNDGSKENYTSPTIEGYLAYGLTKVSICFANDAQQAGERVWENSSQMHNLIDDATGHVLKALAGLTDENHIRSAAWKTLCAGWIDATKNEAQDIPSRKTISV